MNNIKTLQSYFNNRKIDITSSKLEIIKRIVSLDDTKTNHFMEQLIRNERDDKLKKLLN